MTLAVFNRKHNTVHLIFDNPRAKDLSVSADLKLADSEDKIDLKPSHLLSLALIITLYIFSVAFILFYIFKLSFKSLTIKDFVFENDFDIFAITETWLSPGDSDGIVNGNLVPNGYSFKHTARERRGGGVGLLFKKSLMPSKNLLIIWVVLLVLTPWKCKFNFFTTYLHFNTKIWFINGVDNVN